VKVKTHVWFRYLGFVSENTNITSELAETHTDGKATLLFQRPIYHCWEIGWIGSVRSCGQYRSAALSEKPRYPKLGAYPKYCDFTLQEDKNSITCNNFYSVNNIFFCLTYFGVKWLPSKAEPTVLREILCVCFYYSNSYPRDALRGLIWLALVIIKNCYTWWNFSLNVFITFIFQNGAIIAE
jgi:hypothetical protein